MTSLPRKYSVCLSRNVFQQAERNRSPRRSARERELLGQPFEAQPHYRVPKANFKQKYTGT